MRLLSGQRDRRAQGDDVVDGRVLLQLRADGRGHRRDVGAVDLDVLGPGRLGQHTGATGLQRNRTLLLDHAERVLGTECGDLLANRLAGDVLIGAEVHQGTEFLVLLDAGVEGNHRDARVGRRSIDPSWCPATAAWSRSRRPCCPPRSGSGSPHPDRSDRWSTSARHCPWRQRPRRPPGPCPRTSHQAPRGSPSRWSTGGCRQPHRRRHLRVLRYRLRQRQLTQSAACLRSRYMRSAQVLRRPRPPSARGPSCESSSIRFPFVAGQGVPGEVDESRVELYRVGRICLIRSLGTARASRLAVDRPFTADRPAGLRYCRVRVAIGAGTSAAQG